MKTIILTILVLVATSGVAAAQAQSGSGSNMTSCPPNTYLRIDPPPPPSDDPAKPEDYSPKTAREKEQAEQLATQEERMRMHCIAMTGKTPQQ